MNLSDNSVSIAYSLGNGILNGKKMESLKLLGSLMLGVICPDYCRACGNLLLGKHYHVFCKNCWEGNFRKFKDWKCRNCGYPLRLRPGMKGLCEDCLLGKNNFVFDTINYFTLYRNVADIALRELKFSKKKPIAKVIGEFISCDLRLFMAKNTIDMVIPVPLHASEFKERGFNQCEEILKYTSISFSPIVRKVYEIKRQSTLPRIKREANVEGVFDMDGRVDNKRVLIFDDIFTTGSTVNSIAKLLRSRGASFISVYTVTRAI